MYTLLLVFVCWCASASAATAPYYPLENAEQYFEEFIQEYDKHYVDEHEKEIRFRIFKVNLENINRANKDSEHAVFGITQFMDLTLEEFERQFMGRSSPIDRFGDDSKLCIAMTDINVTDVNAPESWDWRSKGVVTPVKAQHDCGSCYAFCTTAHLESQYAIKHGAQLDLSEQEIVDCDRHSIGCFGGLIRGAFRSLIEMGGQMSEADYPYQNRHRKCKFDKSKVVVKVTDCFSYELKSQEKLKQLLYKTGPVVVAIQGNPLHGYKSGIIMDKNCFGIINHGVLLVGYGIEKDIPYWIVKNSYGPNWGEQGYFRVQRGEDAESCQIMKDPEMSTAVIE